MVKQIERLEDCLWKELADADEVMLGRMKCLKCDGKGNYEVGNIKKDCPEYLTYKAAVYLSEHSKHKGYYKRLCELIETKRGLK